MVTKREQVQKLQVSKIDANKTINIGTYGVQELFFVNKKILEVANSTCQSMVLPV